MNTAQIKQVVCEVLQKIQVAQGYPCPELKDKTRPLKDLEKFDSPISIAATGMIGRKLNVDVPAKTNLFGDKEGAFTIEKTIGIICDLIGKKQKGKLAADAL